MNDRFTILIQALKRSYREISYRIGIAIVILVYLFGLTLIFSDRLLNYAGPWFPLYTVCWSLLLIQALIFLRKGAQKAAQKRRDHVALALFNDAMSGNLEKFALYLRPFYITGKIYVKKIMIRPAIISSGEWSGLVSVSAAPRRYGLEESLISGFKRIMPILALGKPGEAQGVGRILTDENSWKAAISELLRHSRL